MGITSTAASQKRFAAAHCCEQTGLQAIILKDVRLEAFLAECLVLWGVAGTVEGGNDSVAAVVHAKDGTILWIERLIAEDPAANWLVRVRPVDAAPGSAREQRPRRCGSLVGVLKALRTALGVDRGSALRIVPPPGDT